MFDYLRRMYLVQRLSFFFEKSFFFLFSEHRFPRINFFKHLSKDKPLVLYFHIFKNRVDLKNFMFITLNFIIKQFNFFFTSKFFKNKAEKNIFNLNFFNIKINFFFFFFILKKLFFKRFHRFLSFIFFYEFDYSNLIKLDFVFFIFLNNSKGLLQFLDMGKFYDWCLYHKVLYKVCGHKLIKKEIKLSKRAVMLIKYFRLKKVNYLKKVYNTYKTNYAEFSNWMISDDLLVDKKKNLTFYKNIFLFRVKNVFFKKFNNTIKNELTGSIKFSDSSMNKYISYRNLKKFNFFFLRKNRIFNKSRYSRNRQLYRTGFYWCLWLNIIIVYGLFFLFYRFTFNFGYLWWGLMFLFYSFIFSKVCKYNFYNVNVLINEFRLLRNWFGLIFIEITSQFVPFVKLIVIKLNNSKIIYDNIETDETDKDDVRWIWYKQNVIDKQFDMCENAAVSYLKKQELDNQKKTFFVWEGYPSIDTSFFFYKSFIHNCGQFRKFLEFCAEEIKADREARKNAKKNENENDVNFGDFSYTTK